MNRRSDLFGAALLLAATFGGVGVSAQETVPAVSKQPMLMMVHVRVADMARSERFYHDVFGMDVSNKFSDREHVLHFPGASPTAAGVILLLADVNTAANGSAPANGGFLVQVPDLDAVMKRAEPAGGKVGPLHESPAAHLRSGFITDPDGARIEVMQYTTP